MASLAAPLLLLATLHVGGVRSTCSNASAVSSGLDALLAEYERAAAPASPVLVRVALDVRHAAVDERSSVVRLLADLHLYWTDTRIAWNVSDWECDSALVPAERLWLPDIELLNGAAGSGGAGDGSLRARVGADSSVAWISRLDVSVPVELDLRDWPNDQQRTVFKFGSREHTIEELDLQINDYKYATVWESGSWEIVSVSGSEAALETAGGAGGAGGARRAAAWAVALRRRAAAHALAGAAVLAAAILLLVAAAVLPPTERPALCACAAFTAALWLISALLRLPGSATYPSSLSVMAGVCGCAGAWAACAALVARVARGARVAGGAGGARPPPAPLRALLAAAPAWCVAAAPDQEHPESASAAWAAAAQLLDSALRAALALVLFVLVCVSL